MDKLISYINSNPEYDLNVFYSTPSIYLKALNEGNHTWTVKTDDFFPYSGTDVSYFDNNQIIFCQCSYWTGFFTSRPELKGYIRTRSSLLHATDGLLAASLGKLTYNEFDYETQLQRIQSLSEAMAIAQHHDAGNLYRFLIFNSPQVTGTEKQHVADDYAERLSIGSEAAYQTLEVLLFFLVL